MTFGLSNGDRIQRLCGKISNWGLRVPFHGEEALKEAGGGWLTSPQRLCGMA